MKNVLIIGNGFDLDLGLPTRYSDFAKSDFWPKVEHVLDRRTIFSKADDMQFHALSISLDNKLKSENWFDLEESLLDYAANEIKSAQDDLYSSEDDINYYERLKSSLCDYLIDVQEKCPIDKTSLASDVLKTVLKNGYFDNIFSFNYTDLNYLARQLGVKCKFSFSHIHGRLSDRSIILGVNETPLNAKYSSLYKTSSEFYRSNNLKQVLDEANEVVFYGFSFGKIDFDYFRPFFRSYALGQKQGRGNPYITIFTKNEKSISMIKERLREEGLDLSQLYSNLHLDFFGHDQKDRTAMDTFFNRIKHSRRRILCDVVKSAILFSHKE